jgi:DnaK suppressor protein
MTKPDLTAYRSTLLALRQRLKGDVSHLADEALAGTRDGGSPSAAPIHPADQGTDAFEQEFTLSLMRNQEEVLQEIGDALDRISRGTFGRCEECQGVIPKARLQTLPYARYCVSCARKAQESS